MIEFNGKNAYPELLSAIEEAGHFVRLVDNQLEVSNPVAVQAIIDAFDPLPIQRAALLEQVAAERIRLQELGVPYVFPDGETGTIQTRHAQDLVNINGLATRAVLSPSGAFVFRDQENRTHAMTAEQIVALAVAASNRVAALYAAKWSHDAAIEAWNGAEPYDLTAFWPEA